MMRDDGGRRGVAAHQASVGQGVLVFTGNREMKRSGKPQFKHSPAGPCGGVHRGGTRPVPTISPEDGEKQLDWAGD